ncbi:hypothetical protein [Halalkalibacter sp. APA_J-10(15)]|uniref:hypothetical protein n=1 Tax=unclassified Halalkalibacter TaxID=2893063 RepID=UPI001FF51737|nr:hypothetical protein [Halalkalibacter sp. APA_J-10(15)]MCK0470316.1 hypothetical protein [Halalkalibacter sp. APA_J-10(15)]
MKLITITSNLWEQYRWPLLLFVRRYENCHNYSLYRRLFHLKKNDLQKPGTCILVAFWEGQLIATAVINHYGTKHSEIVISPTFDRPKIHKRLIHSIIDQLGVFYTKVKYDDERKFKTALESGLVCFSYSQEQETNYLWLGGGHWNTNDVVS